jgi:hypothetical protein
MAELEGLSTTTIGSIGVDFGRYFSRNGKAWRPSRLTHVMTVVGEQRWIRAIWR